MKNKIILIVVDIITFGIGTGVFVTNTLDSREEEAGLGAFMIVFGLLIHYWRKNYFADSNNRIQEKVNNKNESNNSTKPFVIPLLLIIAFSFWGKGHIEGKENADDLNSMRYDIRDIGIKIEDLENNSHYHNY